MSICSKTNNRSHPVLCKRRRSGLPSVQLVLFVVALAFEAAVAFLLRPVPVERNGASHVSTNALVPLLFLCDVFLPVKWPISDGLKEPVVCTNRKFILYLSFLSFLFSFCAFSGFFCFLFRCFIARNLLGFDSKELNKTSRRRRRFIRRDLRRISPDQTFHS